MNIKNKTIVNFILITMISVIAMLFSGCPTGDESVFWTIKDAKLVPDFSLDNNLTINSMDVAGDSNLYLACTTVLYRRAYGAASSVSWDRVGIPAGMKYNTALIHVGANLLCGFTSNSGETGLYTTLVPNIAWTRITALDGKQIIKFFLVGGNTIFCAQDSSGNYSLYQTDGTGPGTSQTAVTGLSQPALAVVFDGTLSWIVTESNIYNSNGALSAAKTTPSFSGLSGPFTGMLYSTLGHYFIATKNGYVYYSTNGSSWSSSSQQTYLNLAVIFTEMSEIGTNHDIFIGSNKAGFYKMKDPPDSNNPLTRVTDNSLINSKLYTAYVLGFFVNGSDVFFRTAGGGLFRNTFSSSTWGADWIQE